MTIIGRDVNEARGGLVLEVSRVRSKKKKRRKKKITTKSTPPRTPRKTQQSGGRDHLETARGETRPTLQSILARFHRYRVCGIRPRTALAISKNDKLNVTHTHTHTDRQIK